MKRLRISSLEITHALKTFSLDYYLKFFKDKQKSKIFILKSKNSHNSIFNRRVRGLITYDSDLTYIVVNKNIISEEKSIQ